ncbi:MAG TPA: hypothetical protein VMZ74_15570 [Ramlibacter sp.]|nr:hypothetical protein [Ramlibacter sp.]
MALGVTVQREADLLIVVGQGRASLADLKGFADLVATICSEEQRSRVLVNLLEVDQDLAFTDHLQLGVYIAEKLGFLSKFATIVPAQYRSGNSERAAQKSGLKIRTFLSLTEARDWLDEPAEA